MPIVLQEITDKNKWNKFIVQGFSFYSFLQSWEWGKINKLENHKVWRFGIFDNSKQIGAMQIFKISARRGTYLFCPHGPLVSGNYFQILKEILPELKKLAKKEKAIFVRFNPADKATVENQKDYQELGFRNAPMHVHAESTWLLDLQEDEDVLMKNLRKTTRYLIKRAEKEGVEIKTTNSPEEIDLFYKLHIKHANREKGNKYTAFSRDFVNNLFEVFRDENEYSTEIQLMSAWYDGVCEASLATIKFGNFCVYYLGASDIKHPKFSPSYLLQWRAISDAKKSGCKFYNFWGIAPNNDKRHPIYGVSQFKKGFGGFGYELLHAQDLVLDWKYWINWVIETVRRKKRGYFYPKPVPEKDFENKTSPSTDQSLVLVIFPRTKSPDFIP